MRLTSSPVRERLAAGAVVTGVIVFSGSPVIVELAAAGLDFVILDMEHSALDLGAAAHLIRAADASGIAAYVRVIVLGTDADLFVNSITRFCEL